MPPTTERRREPADAVLHEGAPVLEGRKYVLRSDVMYEPPEAM